MKFKLFLFHYILSTSFVLSCANAEELTLSKALSELSGSPRIEKVQAAADEAKQDYIEVTFDGQTYYIRG